MMQSDPTEAKTAAPPVPWAIRSVIVPLVLLAVAGGLYVWALDYNATARRFPSSVAILLGLLALVDLYSRTALPGARHVTAFWGADFSRREMVHNPPFGREIGMILWTFACGVGMAVIGILPTVPLFCAAFVILSAGLSVRTGILAGAGIFVFNYCVFELLLDYTLYRGLLFTTGGMAAW
jgi:hypothetical protein